jgi:hypothetical protein
MSNSTPKCQIIEGGRPSPREWTEAEILSLLMPSIKALPFVKLRKLAPCAQAVYA